MNKDHYRHDLSRVEYDYIWSQIQVHWGPIYDDWYPLTGEKCPADTIAFKADEFNQHFLLSTFRQILNMHRISWVWELHEDYSGEEMFYETLIPDYTGNEGYWTSSDFDWLVYVSHENSITIAGNWLIIEIIHKLFIGINKDPFLKMCGQAYFSSAKPLMCFKKFCLPPCPDVNGRR